MGIPISIASKLQGKDTSGVEQNEKYIIFILVAICVGLYYLGVHILHNKIKNIELIKIIVGLFCVILFFVLLSTFIL